MSVPRVIRRAAVVAVLAVLAVGGTASPATAAPLVFPSCLGFDVGLTPLTSHGNPVQAGPRAVQVAGNGSSVLDNETTGATLTFVGSGAFNAQGTPDGSYTFTATGRSIVILFPTDTGGPATTIYTGGLVSTLSADGTFSVVSHTGGVIDVCALLGG